MYVWAQASVLVWCAYVCIREKMYSFHPAYLPSCVTCISPDKVNKPMHTCVHMWYEPWPACVRITLYNLISADALRVLCWTLTFNKINTWLWLPVTCHLCCVFGAIKLGSYMWFSSLTSEHDLFPHLCLFAFTLSMTQAQESKLFAALSPLQDSRSHFTASNTCEKYHCKP